MHYTARFYQFSHGGQITGPEATRMLLKDWTDRGAFRGGFSGLQEARTLPEYTELFNKTNRGVRLIFGSGPFQGTAHTPTAYAPDEDTLRALQFGMELRGGIYKPASGFSCLWAFAADPYPQLQQLCFQYGSLRCPVDHKGGSEGRPHFVGMCNALRSATHGKLVPGEAATLYQQLEMLSMDTSVRDSCRRLVTHMDLPSPPRVLRIVEDLPPPPPDLRVVGNGADDLCSWCDVADHTSTAGAWRSCACTP